MIEVACTFGRNLFTQSFSPTLSKFEASSETRSQVNKTDDDRLTDKDMDSFVLTNPFDADI